MSSALLLALLCMITSAYCLQSCPERPTVQDFDIKAFSGVWHAVRILPNPGLSDTKCPHHIFWEAPMEGLGIILSYYNQTAKDYAITNGSLPKTKNDSSEASFTTIFPGGKIGKFVVLITDYEHYAVLSYCMQLDNQPDGTPNFYESCWVSSRSRILNEKYESLVNGILPPDNYQPANQTDCPPYELNEEKVLRK